MVWQVRLTDHADEALINCNWGFWDGQVTDGCARGKQNCPGWQSGEGEIRRALLEADLVDCMISLPGQLFYSTPIPVCLWFLTRTKSGRAGPPGRPPLRDRSGQTLFIDARNLGTMVDRTHKELTAGDTAKIAGTYHAWRSRAETPAKAGAHIYCDVPGFCKSATLAEITTHGHALAPGRYVGAEEAEDDGEPFEQKMNRLTADLEAEFAESAKLERAVKANLRTLGYDW
jgi:type I restriction enzyme M protein